MLVVRKFTKKRRGGPQSGGHVIQGSDTDSTPMCIRGFGPIDGDGKDGGGTNHRKAGAAEGGRDVGYSKGGSSAGSFG